MLKQLARSALKPVSAGVDYLKRPPAGATVLIYHRVGAGSGNEVDLDASVFADQMAELAESGRVTSLDDALAAVSGPEEQTVDPVVVTFDDGTPDVVENALPILEQHQIPMTLYLATGFVDADHGFWQPSDPVLSWSALSAAVSTGLVYVGSHTHTHALLDRLEGPAVADELDKSIDAIGTHLGTAPRHFAYPKALPPSPAADVLVRERFGSAAIAGTRPNPYGSTDPYLLARSPIQRSDGMTWFRRKAAGGMGFEDRLRDLVNKRRYADASR
ncbi:MAG: polysaccharide deacetylase family protein [Acidimicrobiales bacterium]